ncbi:MAG: hypothetical protein ACTSUO_08965 [Candidatus Thorarchaeota archaeon]
MTSTPDRYWIIYLATIISIVLVLAGGFMYPLNQRDLLEILIFEIVSIVTIIGIMLLIYNRGLPDDVVEARKQSRSD